MKKKKFTIKELKLKSFITSSDSLYRLNGGNSADAGNQGNGNGDKSYNDGWSDGSECPQDTRAVTKYPEYCNSLEPNCDSPLI